MSLTYLKAAVVGSGGEQKISRVDIDDGAQEPSDDSLIRGVQKELVAAGWQLNVHDVFRRPVVSLKEFFAVYMEDDLPSHAQRTVLVTMQSHRPRGKISQKETLTKRKEKSTYKHTHSNSKKEAIDRSIAEYR